MESADKQRKFGLFVTGNSEPVQTWRGDLINLVLVGKGQNISELTGSI
jgi:hypothetical protein